ncbi:MAG: dimethylglycine dehydrogenase, partial [Rhodospirillales bacterium]
MVHGDSEINMHEFDPRRFGSWTNESYVRAKSFEDYNRMYALPAPGEELPTGRLLRTTPIYDKLRNQGCVSTVAFGWERPKWFSSDGREEDYSFRRNNLFDLIGKECKAVREAVGVLDLSSFAKFDVTRVDAEAHLNRLYANRVARKDGGIVLAHMLSPEGRILSESTITRLAKDRYYVLSGAAWEIQDMDRLMAGIVEGDDVKVENVTDAFGVLVVAGPRSRDVLAALTDVDLTNQSFKWL